ncbi:MAG: aminoglycoside phosphotransferase [Alphaproteobacteria bacterium]|nr:aminoglycoside phosphotransferase [Alphaproteobacteria bacterium]
MSDTADFETVAALLRDAGIAHGITAGDLSVLSTKGISHDHWRIGGSELVLRIPRMNQWDLGDAEALRYQETAFRRAAESGATPKCIAALAPAGGLPHGALVVEEITGRPPDLPADLDAICDALTAIHGVPLLDEIDMPPLRIHRNPMSSTLQTIEEQAAYLPDAGLDRESLAGIREDLNWAREFAGHGEPDFALCLAGTDTHPGNFLIDDAGKAWFVDLEKALYGAAPIDLAHATLATSTGWDPDCTGSLTPDDVQRFYQRYLDAVGRDRAAELGPWLLPMRRLTWLRTITWFARWIAAWSDGGHAAARDARMRDHIRRHIERSFDPETIADCRRDWLAPRALTI